MIIDFVSSYERVGEEEKEVQIAISDVLLVALLGVIFAAAFFWLPRI